MWRIIAAVGWALWKSRNDLVFSNIIDKSPKQVAYRVFGFLKQWLKLSKEDARSKMEAMLMKMKEGLPTW